MLRNAIVTGCSKSSIGFLAAKVLASQHNYRVILACRNEEKGKDAEQTILSEFPQSQVKYVPLDLASFDSIRSFVATIRQVENGVIAKQGLDLLVNNAGIGWVPSATGSGDCTPYKKTQDGLEEIVGVNHFGTFLLTQLLLEDLKRSKDTARIVVLTSSLHKLSKGKGDGSNGDQHQLLLPNFPHGILHDGEGPFDGSKAYRISKLCNLWFTYELHRQLLDEQQQNSTSPSIVVNSLSPGFIPATGLGRNTSAFGKLLLRFVLEPLRYLGIATFVRTPEDGANSIVQASVGTVASVGGQYLHLPSEAEELQAIESSLESRDMEKAAALWTMSMDVCKLK